MQVTAIPVDLSFKSSKKKGFILPPAASVGNLCPIVGSVRRYYYEVFVKFHLLLAGVLVVAVWRHTNSGKSFTTPTIYLLAVTGIWLLTNAATCSAPPSRA